MMIDLHNVAHGFSSEEVADAVYFAIRYVKQVALAHRTGNEIFQDATRSAPTDRVQQLTTALIQEIEKQLGQAVSSVGPEQFRELIGSLTALTQGRRGIISNEDRVVAEALAAELSTNPLDTR